MSREIKFRAWDKPLKTMFKVHGWHSEYCFEDTFNGIGATPTNPANLSDCDLMQFIGLKDKNGVEIYEGDILKTETDKNMVVGWSNRHASFVLEREEWAFKHYFGEAADHEYVEVIGNIYQNAELLQAIA